MASEGSAASRFILADSRLILGLILVVAALAGGTALAKASRTTRPVLVAAHTIRPNAPVAVDDFAIAEVRIPPAQSEFLVSATDRDSLTGLITTRALDEGELLTRSVLAQRARPKRQITISIPGESALLDQISIGERVDVIATLAKGSADSRTVVLARGAEVASTPPRAERGAMGAGAGSASEAITLAVEGREAMAIAFASNNGEIALVTSSGPEIPLPNEVNAETIASPR